MSNPMSTSSTTTMTLCAAAQTAIDAPSDRSLRVPCFCEENIWRLAYRHLYGGGSSSNSGTDISSSSSSSSPSSCWYVVFVSNPIGCVPMMQQLAAVTSSGLNDTQKNQPVFWDYHVILVERRRSRRVAANNNATTAEVTTEEHRTSSSWTTKPISSPSFSSYVWDIDSLLPCPCPIEEYLESSFSNHTNWPSKYRPLFRYVCVALLL